MTKTEAISLLGGSVARAAEAIGINSQAISQWPTELPARLIDRVQAALWRMQQEKAPSTAIKKVSTPEQKPCVQQTEA